MRASGFLIKAFLVAGAVAVTAPPLEARGTAPTADLGEGAPKRFAIVIGNGDYRVAPDLKNALADAELVADFLNEQDYAVIQYTDLDKAGFEAMLQRILFEVDKDSEVVFYFAGHGVQIAGANYLIPIDADFDDPYDLPLEAVSLNTIVSVLGARARTQIVILDSCRTNPFAGATVMADITDTLSETRDGFNVLTAPVNSLLAFSTSPGTTAWDGAGDQSPFTAALIGSARETPGRPIGEILEGVRRQVYASTGGRQVPWESSTLVQSVAFGIPSRNDPLGSTGAPDAGVRRSWMSPTMPQAMVTNTRVAPDGGGTIEMIAREDREVMVGPAILAELDLAPDAPVTVSVPPARGRGTIALPDGRRVDVGSQDALFARDLETMTFERTPGPASAAPDEEARPTNIVVTAAGEPVAVDLTLEPDPCDVLAADHLDPEGVGDGLYPNEIDIASSLPACEKAASENPDVGRFHYQLGRVQLANRDFAAAQASFERARGLGHTRASVALGLLVANSDAPSRGRGDAPAPAEALALYQEGVDAGDPYAIHTLGRELLRHGATEEERRRGFQLLQQSVEVGHTFSMNELGAYYMSETSPDSDPQRGLTYIQASAARGDIYGYHNLGLVYLDGLAGMTPDLELAAEWFEKAAAGGHPAAPGALGRLWNSGALGEADRYARAVAWYDQGLARCDGWSGANAGWIIASRNLDDLAPRDAAVRAAKAAVLTGDDSAEEAQGLLAELDRAALDGAAQMLVNDLGGSVAVDGVFGPSSAAELARIMAGADLPVPEAAPVERLLALARAYWQANPCRVDLY